MAAKKSKIDDILNGASKIFTIGENPDDKVVMFMRRILSWCKYILGLEIMIAFIAGLPAYGIYKIKRGEIDELAETVVKVADIAFMEEAEASDNTENEVVAKPADETEEKPVTPPPTEECRNCHKEGEWKFTQNKDGHSEYFHSNITESCGLSVITDENGNVLNW